jgi:hypothetical protein
MDSYRLMCNNVFIVLLVCVVFKFIFYTVLKEFFLWKTSNDRRIANRKYIIDHARWHVMELSSLDSPTKNSDSSAVTRRTDYLQICTLVLITLNTLTHFYLFGRPEANSTIRFPRFQVLDQSLGSTLFSRKSFYISSRRAANTRTTDHHVIILR